MIRTEILKGKYTRTYSDIDHFIAKVEEPEILYVDAVDPIDSGREYFETDVPIEEEEDIEEGDYDD